MGRYQLLTRPWWDLTRSPLDQTSSHTWSQNTAVVSLILMFWSERAGAQSCSLVISDSLWTHLCEPFVHSNEQELVNVRVRAHLVQVGGSGHIVSPLLGVSGGFVLGSVHVRVHGLPPDMSHVAAVASLNRATRGPWTQQVDARVRLQVCVWFKKAPYQCSWFTVIKWRSGTCTVCCVLTGSGAHALIQPCLNCFKP